MRVDGGANCFVINEERYFITLIKKEIECNIALNVVRSMQGIGLIVAEFEQGILEPIPAYLSLQDKNCTLSPGALQAHSQRYHQTAHYPFKFLKLYSRDEAINIPTNTNNGLDYVTIKLHYFKSKPRPIESKYNCPPAVANIELKRNPGNYAMYLHLKYGHLAEDYLKKMIDKGLLTGVTKPQVELPFPCPMCPIIKAKRLPKGKPVDTSELRKGEAFHLDFMIVNVPSCRDFVAALNIICARSRYPWSFCTRSRRPPIAIITFFVRYLRRKGYPVTEFRIDEDGALAKSSNFMQHCRDKLEIKIDTTGGYNSTNNAKVEAPHQFYESMMRASLIGAGLPDQLWCFAHQHAIETARHRYNRMIDSTPAMVWSDGESPVKVSDLKIFGSKVYIIGNKELRKMLEPRSEKDPRDYIGLTIHEAALPEHFDGYFVGWGNHRTVILVWDPLTRRIRRVHHAIIDEFNMRVLPTERFTPNTVLLTDFNLPIFDDSGNLDTTKMKLVQPKLQLISSALNEEECVTISVHLPPSPRRLGLTLIDDDIYGMPILSSITPRSPLRAQIPIDMHRNCFIVAINSESRGYIEPISSEFCIEELRSAQQRNDWVQVELTFCRHFHPVPKSIEEIRATFDAMPTPSVNYIMSSPIRPEEPKSFAACLKTPDKQHWKAAAFHQYSKNAKLMLLSAPCPRDKLPPKTKIYRSVVSPRVKEKGHALFQLQARHCVDGAKMVQGLDFDLSYAPTASAPAIRTLICDAAATGKRLGIIDVINAFQNSLVPEESRVFITCPPYYIEWFQATYPNIKLEDSKSGYVLQTRNGMQGKKDTGHTWYLIVHKMLLSFGFIDCPAEPALFVWYQEGQAMAITTSTDDFLCSYSHESAWTLLKQYINGIVPITSQESDELKYLNLRIYQSDQAITIDQTEHIKTNVIDPFFPAPDGTNVKTVETPFRTDTEYEKELQEALPATHAELRALEQEYNGAFGSHMGAFNHIWQFTRPDLGFSCCRLAQHNASPTAPAFQGLKRVARYLRTYPHAPIAYPRKVPYDSTQEIKYTIDPGNFESMMFPNNMTFWLDADHARDNATRRSTECILVTLLGVLVHWKMQKQSFMAAHTTEAEAGPIFTSSKINSYMRQICEFLRIPTAEPTPFYGDNQAAIDIIRGNQITARAKHFAVRIAFAHEKHALGEFKMSKVSTQLNIADFGTKPNPAPVFHRHYSFSIGQRYYPLPGTNHFASVFQPYLPEAKTVTNSEKQTSKDKLTSKIDASAQANTNITTNPQ